MESTNGFLDETVYDQDELARPQRHAQSVALPRQGVRPLSVEEAMQYTPLASIIPFGPDFLPAPSIGVPVSHSLLTQFESEVSSQWLDALDKEMQDSQNASGFSDETFDEMREAIDSKSCPCYVFKKLHGITPKIGGEDSSITSPFARRLLQSSNVSYRHAPSKKSHRKSNGVLPPPQHNGASPSVPKGSSKGHEKHSGDTPSSTDMRTMTQPVVIVPPPSRTGSLAQETTRRPRSPHFEIPIMVRNEKDPSHAFEDDELQHVEYREKNRNSTRNLTEVLTNVFEAEDQLQPDTSGHVVASSSEYFTENETDQGNGFVLSSTVQLKIDQLLQSVIKERRLSEIPADNLTRLYRLCEYSLHAVEAIDIHYEHATEQAETWSQRIKAVENGLLSARILLRIMTGGRQEKEMFSEETMQAILNVLKNVVDSCITPIVELRGTSSAFKSVSLRKKGLVTLVNYVSRTLLLLSNLICKEEVSDGAVTTVEFMSTGLIFVENAPSEKDSVIGIQKFERLRVSAMDSLAKIFSKYPDQRTFIFDEILTSLEKLPVVRQSAKSFKLIEGSNIQLVSALIMRLIQASAAKVKVSHDPDTGSGTSKPSNKGLADLDGDSADNDDRESRSPSRLEARISLGDKVDTDVARETDRLRTLAQPLLDGAQKNVQYVTQFLVSRALKSTKTGDDPYRVLLDIFVEDFIAALPSTDWPAAELLLRSFLTSMVGIAEGEKSTAPAKVLALDHLAMMGSAICDLRLQIQQMSRSPESADNQLSRFISNTASASLAGSSKDSDFVSWDGLFRITLEYLQERDLGDEQLRSARGYLATLWASRFLSTLEDPADYEAEEESDRSENLLASHLRKLILDEKWLQNIGDFDSVTTLQGRLSYAAILMSLPFGKAFERILMIFLNSSNSDQALVRSKSLKSVVQLLEKDPSILDRGAYLIRLILKKSSDTSPLVRDSALGLIGKCMSLKPELENELWEHVLQRSMDAVVGVRKRAMKILKDVYLNNPKPEVKSAIADALLHRTKDSDEGVADLARTTFEDVWISPFSTSVKQDLSSPQNRLALKNQVFHITRTISRNDSVCSVLESLLRSLLSESASKKEASTELCRSMISIVFDKIIDEGDDPDCPGRPALFLTLTVFAKACGNSFAAEQLELLQPYVENLSKNDDLSIYRSAIIIFRWVLPKVEHVKPSFLATLQKSLLGSISILLKRELNEAIACLWTLNGMLRNVERLARVALSCLKSTFAARNEDLSAQERQPLANRLTRFLTIAGLFGKHCNFSSQVGLFKSELSWWKGDSVPGLMIHIFAPFTTPKQPALVRRAALESLGLVCESWPKHFLDEQVFTAFGIVFDEQNREFEHLILSNFRDFLTSEEIQGADGPEKANVNDLDVGASRLGGAIAANQEDGVTASIAQRYLQQAVRISLSTQDSYALTAAEVIAAVSRQGLVHPKECAPVLVALETSQNSAIASLACREHRTLHQKHETIVEKEYMRAVRQAYEYQRDVIQDSRGASPRPFCSKLHSLYEIIKTSKIKTRRKFLGNVCSRVDFDLSKLDICPNKPPHLEYAQFLIENLAFFEYATVDELLFVVSSMEKVVSNTGTSVAHLIEAEFPRGEANSQSAVFSGIEIGRAPDMPPSQTNKLRRMTTAALILSHLWSARTFLRRYYGLNRETKHKDVKGKGGNKDLNKAPVRVSGINGEKLWEQGSNLGSAMIDASSMKAECWRFAELLAVDNELKLANDSEEQEEQGFAALEKEDTPGGTPSSKRKRKSGSETPSKRTSKKRRSSFTRGKSRSVGPESEDEDDVVFFN